MQVPYVFERLVVSDRRVAEKAASDGQPVFAPPFGLPGSEHWWEPVRKNVVQFLGEDEVLSTTSKGKTKKVVTYLHTQSETTGGKLSEEDHAALSESLSYMAKKNGYEYHVVSTQTAETDWTERMMAIVKSSVSYYFLMFLVLILTNIS